MWCFPSARLENTRIINRNNLKTSLSELLEFAGSVFNFQFALFAEPRRRLSRGLLINKARVLGAVLASVPIVTLASPDIFDHGITSDLEQCYSS